MYVGVRVRGGGGHTRRALPPRAPCLCVALGADGGRVQSPEAQCGPRTVPPGPFSHSSWPLFVRLCGDRSCFRETLRETEQ